MIPTNIMYLIQSRLANSGFRHALITFDDRGFTVDKITPSESAAVSRVLDTWGAQLVGREGTEFRYTLKA